MLRDLTWFNYRWFSHNSIFAVVCLLILSLGACGGSSGGGDDFAGAGRVSVSASPKEIDIGDRQKVTVDISDTNDDGVILKMRYPSGLSYVQDSSFLEVDERELDIGPQVNADDGNEVYLVYFFPKSLFDENGDGVLTFLLEGNDEVTRGKIEVDIDVDDPLIDDSNEFDTSNPEFQSEDEVDIKVEA